jgi:hypothetical protein
MARQIFVTYLTPSNCVHWHMVAGRVQSLGCAAHGSSGLGSEAFDRIDLMSPKIIGQL